MHRERGSSPTVRNRPAMRRVVSPSLRHAEDAS
jgi:hypothetical protein